ncbi:Mor transcription activator family protein [Spongiibacter sp. UBA1325]|uniref:Mor transcription activator family protein n=1 Tax=Spongiibacter sp. UBA1325 TaxID=1947543 RepID=UPI00257B2D75|nr:Mor transcription activator family protein [Spongiibacter sp. UBA1325]|tara:strand:+ start:1643 stop:2032 length:390 start_codon:yes stop_codon:yes gene_type:complete
MNPLASANLPSSLTDVVHAIGLNATLTLVEHLGGTRVYVPEQLPDSHLLARLLGHRAAHALAATFPGEALDLPRCTQALRHARDQLIRQARAGGASVRSLALKHGLTERQIYVILAAGEQEASPQQRLL